MSWVEGPAANWPAGQVWMSSPTECMCTYFDDLYLSAGLDGAMRKGLLTSSEVAMARRFHEIADSYRIPSGSAEETIADPQWAAVVKEAAAFWIKLEECAEADDLAEMAALEGRFGQIHNDR